MPSLVFGFLLWGAIEYVRKSTLRLNTSVTFGHET